MSELKLGIPKGSLEEMTIELFKKSGWKISTTSRSYFPSIDDDTIRCSLARPQEMSRYVEMGTLDVGDHRQRLDPGKCFGCPGDL